MNKWETLPNEVLNQIVNHLGNDCNKNKWMFVNKQWFNLFLSMVYKNTSIRLEFSDKKLNKILNSTFQPGKWVKHMNFTSFITPANIDDLNLDQDPLNLLMTHTPNVEEIEFEWNEKMNTTDWAYFSTVLIENGVWKLRSVPEPWNSKLIYSAYYYNCAYHSRNTLTKLNLTQGMIGRNFSCLTEFKELESLDVNRNVLKDMSNFDSLMQHLPELEEVDVDFATNRSEEENYPSGKSCAPSNTYPKLRKASFINYTPSRDEELLIFMKKFEGLEELLVVANKNSPWPAASVSPFLTRSFFEYLDKIPTYRITVGGDAQKTQFAYECFAPSQERGIHLSAVFTPQNGVRTLRDDDCSISMEKYGRNSNTILRHRIIDDPRTERLGGKHILSHINQNVHLVEIDMGDAIKNEWSAGIYIRTLLETEHKNLRKIVVKGAILKNFTDQEISARQYANCLEFENTCVFTDVLSQLSNSIHNLEELNLIGCKFSDNNIVISMLNTDIGTISLSDIEVFGKKSSFDQNVHSIVIISVVSVDQDFSKYYMSIDRDHLTTEIGKTTFELFKAKFNAQEITIIKLHVKSIKNFSLHTMFSTCHNIEISFP